ncbi:hypothetical protein LXL04_019857 [Taraxacum kok-saghyz]
MEKGGISHMLKCRLAPLLLSRTHDRRTTWTPPSAVLTPPTASSQVVDHVDSEHTTDAAHTGAAIGTAHTGAPPGRHYQRFSHHQQLRSMQLFMSISGSCSCRFQVNELQQEVSSMQQAMEQMKKDMDLKHREELAAFIGQF